MFGEGRAATRGERSFVRDHDVHTARPERFLDERLPPHPAGKPVAGLTRNDVEVRARCRARRSKVSIPPPTVCPPIVQPVQMLGSTVSAVDDHDVVVDVGAAGQASHAHTSAKTPTIVAPVGSTA